ncbi:putative beta-galactosidase [Helianthus debilis subsp. tardiflorus]
MGPWSMNLERRLRPDKKWAAKMVVGLETGVPRIMCKEDDVLDLIVNPSCVFMFLFSFCTSFLTLFILLISQCHC